MKILFFALFLAFFPAFFPAPQGPPPMPLLPLVHCPASDPCPDETRPWMRGTVEKWCGRDDAALAKIQQEFPNVTANKCACVHMCDKDADHADETQGRMWDARCQVRCNPKHCTCPNRCDS